MLLASNVKIIKKGFGKMVYVVAAALVFILILIGFVFKQSIVNAKKMELLEDQVFVSEDLLNAAIEVNELLTSASSIDYQRKNLPRAISALDGEILKYKRSNTGSFETKELTV